ncbi:MAG: RNA polymerase subunit sigma [Butyrivibrio sp.]|uniref:sigma factor n=1 Tax=Butyrivibrio sp. TaxID=28121 RepID=UPI001B00C628|nr:sigma factor [Butyrivibrio sp.]MBO6240557.1 RNA polymerase subunit sigma [Butyrivibrio sp.]
MEKNAFSAEALEVKETPSRLDSFIEKNTSYIKYCAYKSVGKFITESDDEYSIALSAFLEAINSYDDTKGAFSSFSQLVIKRRLLDHLRKNKHLEYELSVEPGAFEGDIDDDDQNSLSLELRSKSAEISFTKDSSLDRHEAIKDEIESISIELSLYGFGFMDLVKSSPSASKTKKACAVAIKTIIDSKDLLTKMKHSKSLPMKELVELTGISRKLLDRYRRYIIAAVLILDGDYPLLSEYMRYIKNFKQKPVFEIKNSPKISMQSEGEKCTQ